MARPRKYDHENTNDVKLFAEQVDAYFDKCDATFIDVPTPKGVVKHRKPYTVLGMCEFLGITRETLCEYEKLGSFSDTISRAKERIEADKQEGALIGRYNAQFTQFDLMNNSNWRNKESVDVSNFDFIVGLVDSSKEE